MLLQFCLINRNQAIAFYIVQKMMTGEDVNAGALKYFFRAYVVDRNIREILNAKDFHALQTNATLPISEFKKVAPKYRDVIPVYINNYVNLEQFVA